jgi:hypothetical protein
MIDKAMFESLNDRYVIEVSRPFRIHDARYFAMNSRKFIPRRNWTLFLGTLGNQAMPVCAADWLTNWASLVIRNRLV